jgi:hypothetical protein
MEQCTPLLLEMGGRRGIVAIATMDTMEATRPLVMMWWQRAEEVVVIVMATDVMEEVEEEVAGLGANQVEQSS